LAARRSHRPSRPVVNSEAAPFWFKQLTSQAQFAAGGISLPDTYDGELTVLIREARYLRVGGVRGMLDVSDPYCVCVLGAQSVESRRSKSTGDKSYRQGHPVWNQEFQFLVEDKSRQMIHVSIKDSKLTFKPDLGQQVVPLSDLEDGRASARWVRLTPSGRRSRGAQSFGRFLPKRRDPEVLLELTYKAFDDDDEFDSGFREALASRMDPHVKSSDKEIVDIRSAVKATREAAAASAQTAAKTAAAKASFAKYAALKALRSQRPEAANGSEKQQYESSLPAAGDSEAVATDDDMRGANGSSASNGSSSNGSSSSNDLHSNHAEEVEDEKVVDVLPKDTL